MSSSPSPLTLIIRFAISIPDLRLPIDSPATTNAATICTLIRPHLPVEYSKCPLRLIYAGGLLPTLTPLPSSLRLPANFDDGAAAAASSTTPQQLYIHCSISSDAQLSASGLESEAADAILLTKSPGKQKQKPKGHRTQSQSPHRSRTNSSAYHSTSPPLTPEAPDSVVQQQQQQQRQNQANNRTTDPAPQGFDRLLGPNGLSAAEVASLRSQFLAIQSHIHTPDTMPTAAELRRMEERWLDSSGGTTTTSAPGDIATTTPGGGGGGAIDDDDPLGGSGAGGLEDMLWGNLMGFFWAVGAVVWLVREEGVWSRRRQVGVLTGVLVNLTFCFLRVG